MRSDRVEELLDGLLTLRSSFAGSAYWVTLSGELDSESLSSFTTEMARIEGSSALEAVIDLSELDFIDPSGMTALVVARKQFQADGRCLRIIGNPRRFRAASE